MSITSDNDKLEFLFHPRSVALVGISISNPGHWTRATMDGLLSIGFAGPVYPVNLKGGEIDGLKVYTALQDIPGPVDYVIGLVPYQAAPELVEDCAHKGVKAIHFCTAGFSETGEEEGIMLEAELAKIAGKEGIRIIGPNCMGIYCPESRLSYSPLFPNDSGPVGIISQSGGNSISIVRTSALRGVRFSRVISYGNACDLNECDFLGNLADDPETKIIAMYIEGTNDGQRLRKALERAAQEKVLVLLKGGITEGGARTVAGHTSALAGSEIMWDSLCKQLGIIRVHSINELIDVLVTLLFFAPVPTGRNAAVVGAGGGSSVMVADAFEKKGLKVPQLPQDMINSIRGFTPVAGNILQNPMDYGQSMAEIEKYTEMINIVTGWEKIDYVVRYVMLTQIIQPTITEKISGKDAARYFLKSGPSQKPVAMVVEPQISPKEAEFIYSFIQECVSLRAPIYDSFDSAANAISIVLQYNERYPGRLESLH